MKLSHTRLATAARFDEPNLVSSAGLVPVLALADSVELRALADEHLSVPSDKGANAGLKVASLVAGMVAGADSIDDMALLRHGGMGRVFTNAHAPSTLGSFLRSFTFGHVRQLDAVAARLLTGLAASTPLIEVGASQRVLVDVDDTIIEVHGYAKQGAGFGYSGVRGLNALIATVTTAGSAPVIVAQRLRKGSCGSPRGAKRLVADALKTIGKLPGRSPVKPLLRTDSAFYGAATVGAAIRGGADVSVTVRLDAKVKAAIAAIGDDAWSSIEYTDAVFDESTNIWVSRAEVAEIGFTAFSSKTATERVPGRLVVRRIPDLNPHRRHGQDALFDTWRFHAFFTTTDPDDLDTVAADKTHRGHALSEQVHADLKNSALAHLPSGKFTANVDPNTPINLADSPLDYSHADLAPVSPLPPPAADSLTSTEMALSAGDLEQELWHAFRRRQAMPPREPSDEQLERALTRAADAEFSPVTPERIAALNEQAARFYQHTYPGSWAQAYLTDRLGADLTGDPATRPGYAPTGWTALTTHLHRRGATDHELLAAGLAKQASTGRLIDTFRDRLVLPIHHHREQTSQIVGFVTRRHPDTDHHETGSDTAIKAGPKYLNTAETVLFAKGEQLYGMAEHAGRLNAGATPVLVEGPIDALAITLASPQHVGVAPLGTALTDTQADTLIPYLHTTDDRAGAAGKAGVIVATDPDLAGQLAAERDYWMLTARGGDPRHATLPPGQDPADLLRTAGPAALRDRLHQARPLADTLIDERLADLPPTPALHEALTVVAAGHPQHWTDRTADIARRLHAPTDVALTQLLPQITAWDRDRHTASDRLGHAGAETRNRITAHATQTPAQRWAPLARQIHPALIAADDWGALANRIDRTHQAGHDVQTLLPAIAAQAPLSHDQPATDLRYRLTALVDLPDESRPASSPRPTSAARPPSRVSALRHPPTPTQSPDTGPRR